MKTSPEDCDVLLVGGCSIIAPFELKGVKNMMYDAFVSVTPKTDRFLLSRIPKHHEVANAVGAAIASVSGEIDTIEILQGRNISDALQQIKERAIEEAVKTGAARGTVGIVDVIVLPVQVGTPTAFPSLSINGVIYAVCHESSDTYHCQSRWRAGTRREGDFIGW